jgi:hypothetical protein
MENGIFEIPANCKIQLNVQAKRRLSGRVQPSSLRSRIPRQSPMIPPLVPQTSAADR